MSTVGREDLIINIKNSCIRVMKKRNINRVESSRFRFIKLEKIMNIAIPKEGITQAIIR